jgi:hypothetical protein
VPAEWLRLLALAGNGCALVLLTALVVVLRFAPASGPFVPLADLPPPDIKADRVLLVILDGVPASAAFDAARMPHLASLARRHGAAVSRVESLLPATVVALPTLVEGRVPPPLLALQDFAASAAGSGGLFATLQRHGAASFVAGPALWQERYGRWLDGSASVPAGRQRDDALLDATLAALDSRRFQLVVVHLTAADAAAHRHNATSVEYQAALATLDRAVARLWSARSAATAMIITADNGVTPEGGHAGPEPAVLNPPLLLLGPGLPAPAGTVPQRQIPALVEAALGLTPTSAATTAATAAPLAAPIMGDKAEPGWGGALAVALLLGAGITSHWLWQALRAGWCGASAAFAASAALWLCLGLLIFAPLAAAWFALVALLGVALIAPWPRPPTAAPLLLCAGLTLGAIRLLEGFASLTGTWAATWLLAALMVSVTLHLRHQSRRAVPWQQFHSGATPAEPPAWTLGAVLLLLAAPAVGGVLLLGTCLTGLLWGRTLARAGTTPARAAAAGLTCAGVLVVLNRIGGDALSLSGLDVSAAYATWQSPAGLPGAVAVAALRLLLPAVAALRLLLPAVALAAGLAHGLMSGGNPAPRPAVVGSWAAGLGAGLAGSGIVGGLAFAIGHNQQVLAMLAMALVLRPMAEACGLMLGLVLFLRLACPASLTTLEVPSPPRDRRTTKSPRGLH